MREESKIQIETNMGKEWDTERRRQIYRYKDRQRKVQNKVMEEGVRLIRTKR